MSYPKTDFSEGITGENLDFTAVISQEVYANIYGPTTGGKIRLGDTNLYAEIERDFAVYGDECVFGGGKVIRDGMGQACGYPPDGALDTVITNAVIIDYSGIFKADIGIKDGLIVSLGKAGNPDIMDGVFSNMIIGVNSISFWTSIFCITYHHDNDIFLPLVIIRLTPRLLREKERS